MPKMKGLFITGTDTNIGKTIITIGLYLLLKNKGLKVKVIKPFQTGHSIQDIQSDGQKIRKFTQSNAKIEEIVLVNFLNPLAPAAAARLENKNINLKEVFEKIKLSSKNYDLVLIEGAGGLMVPINNKATIADFAKMLNFPLIIVTRPNLGTINHTTLTCKVADSFNLKHYVIINNSRKELEKDLSFQSNPYWITKLAKTEILGHIPFLPNLNTQNILAKFKENIKEEKLRKLLENL